MDESTQKLNPEQASKLLDESPAAIVILDNIGIYYANRAFYEMTGTPNDVPLKGALFTEYLHPSCFNYFVGMMEKISTTRQPESLEAICLANGNVPFNVYMRGGLISLDRNYLQLIINDISDLKRHLSAVSSMSKSGMLGHEQGKENALNQIQDAINSAQRRNTHLALFYISINNLRFITESYGFHFSDTLLQAVTQRLKKVAMSSEKIIPLGNENFLIIVREVENINLVNNLIQKFIKVLEQPYELNDREFIINFTAGMSIYPENGIDDETLFANAKIANEMAKEKGQKKYLLFTPNMAYHARKNNDLMFSLKHALENNEFKLYYQPVLDCKTGKLVALEALLRWISNNELILPSAFLSFAEESGLLLNICDWAIQQACEDNSSFQQKGTSIVPISINLSNYQFDKPTILLKSIANALTKTALSPSFLQFEMSENVTVLEFVAATVDSIKKLGSALTIDNFGASYVSLMEIKRFNVNNIKIDQTLIAKLPHDEYTTEVVNAIIAMAMNLKINVIAEGVETHDQYKFLTDNNCHLLQGNYICQPVNSTEMYEVLSGKKTLPIMKLLKSAPAIV